MESMTVNYTALAKQTETLCILPKMESDSCCQGEKRLRAHDTFLHLTDLFVDGNRLHQWRKPKDNQIDHTEVSVALLPSVAKHIQCRKQLVSLASFRKPSDLDEVIRDNRPRSPGTASTQVRFTVCTIKIIEHAHL